MDPIIPAVFTIQAIRAIGAIPPSDWTAIRSIYLEGIATGDATFEAGRSNLGGVGQGSLGDMPAPGHTC